MVVTQYFTLYPALITELKEAAKFDAGQIVRGEKM
jgi:hypothetical protein